MPAEFEVSIFTAEAIFYQGPCVSLIVPTVDGQFGVMAHHINSVSAVIPGALRYTLPGKPRQTAFVSSGVIKIEDNRVLILVDAAERPEEIDLNRARRAQEAARERLMHRQSKQEFQMNRMYLARAVNRMRVKKQYRRND